MKRRMAVAFWCLVACAAEGAGPEALLGAYYYPWYDNAGFNSSGEPGSNTLIHHLDPQMAPELGWYDQNDPAIIGQHYDWARHAGIDFFVCSYWGEDSRTDQIIRNKMFGHSKLGNMKLCVLLEPSLTPKGGASVADMTAETNFLCDHYFNQPSYLKIDGKPVIFIYITRAMNDTELALCLDTIRAAATLKGVDLYIAGDEVWGAPDLPSDTPRVSQLDAVTNYDVYGNLGAARFVTDAVLDQWQSRNTAWKGLANDVGADFIPAISPGYNDTAVRDGHQPCSRKLNDESHEFGTYFSGLIDRLEPSVGMVMINSWNEWHEDTQIEPIPVAAATTADDGDGAYTDGLSYEGYGMRYLDMLRSVFTPRTIRYRESGDYLVAEGWEGGIVPNAFDVARVNWAGNTVTLSGMAPDITHLQAGHDESGALVIASGGSLTTTGWSKIGTRGESATGTLTVEGGGVMNVDSHLWVGVEGSTGVIHINGGILNVGGIIGLGTVNAVDPSGGVGIVNVRDGGLLALSNIHGGGTSVQPGSRIDLSGGGRMTLPGNFVGVIQDYIDNGYILGDGVTGSSALAVEHDAEANLTTVAAVSGPPFQMSIVRAGDGFQLSWPSRAGMLYRVRGSGELTGDVSTWALVEDAIAATPGINSLSVARESDRQFYVVEEYAPTAP